MKWPDHLDELISDWRYLVKKHGLPALPLIAKALINLPYRHLQFVVMACPLSTALPNLPANPALLINPFSAAHLKFVHREHLPSEANLCAQHLKLGHTGLIARLNNQPAGYGWGCADTTLEKVKLPFNAGDILCTDAFTAPSFRGQGVQTALTLARLRLFQEQGYHRALAYIDIHNKPSLAVWRKVNSQIISRIEYKRLGWWRQSCYSTIER